MIKDNKDFNNNVKPNTEFLNELKRKLPEFFIGVKNDENGELLNEDSFDIEKFRQSLKENNIDEIQEGYQLSFIGKDYAKKQSGERPVSVVTPDLTHNSKEINKGSNNLFFTGDNLEVLRHLQSNYQNCIDVIYIDPPYNTGSDGFVYPDKFEYNDESLKEIFNLNDNELIKLKSIQGKSTHSAWLSFIYPRIFLAKRLLTEDGLIYISIDDNEYSNLLLILNEIFGEENHLCTLIRKTSYGEKTSKPMINKHHEYLLLFSRNISAVIDSNRIKGKLKDFSNYNNPDNDPKGPWIKDSYLIKIDSGRFGHARYPIKNPFLNITHYPPVYYNENDRKQWHYVEETFNQYVKEKKVVFYKNTEEMGSNQYSFFIKKYLNEVNEQYNNISSVDYNSNDYVNAKGTKRMSELFKGENSFSNSYPKPVNFIKEIIEHSTFAKGDVVFDFFAGSGTTADAVMQLNAEDGGNRKFIMCQINELTHDLDEKGNKIARRGSEAAFNAGYMSIDEISRERIKRAAQKISSDIGLTLPSNFDGGFKHYRVVKPYQPTLNDLDSFDIETGMFTDSKGNTVAFPESGFDDMIKPFSSEALNVSGDATGIDTILTTWMVQDGYRFDVEKHTIELDEYTAYYFEESRIYLVEENWESKHTKQLLNIIGRFELNVQTIVLYGYSFSLESIRELELGLKQLPVKVNLVKRY